MRVGRRLLLLAPLLAVAAAAAAAAFAGTVSWGSAIEVPGLAALNVGGRAEVASLSCPSSGGCTAGGFYEKDASATHQAFVVSEQGGVWGAATEVPGTAALSVGGNSWVNAVSCSSPGNCAAGGSYEDGSYAVQAFVAAETNGVWGKAMEVPVPNVGGAAVVTSVSCGSDGNCSAVGSYTAGTGKARAFVVSQKGGKWGRAFDLQPLTAPAASSDATSVSCTGAAACVAGGERSGKDGALLAVETNGKWARGTKVPGLAALDAGGAAWVSSVSCTSPRNCAAAGWYRRGSQGRYYAFVVAETNGTWGTAIKVPGVDALNFGGGAGVISISCSSAGNCAVGGSYFGRNYRSKPFVVAEKNGKWGRAIGLALDDFGYSAVNAVSCASAGNCAAVGSFATYYGPSDIGPTDFVPFVVAERNGVWGSAEGVPGTQGSLEWLFPTPVSCARAGSCAIGGSFDGSSVPTAFVTAP